MKASYYDEENKGGRSGRRPRQRPGRVPARRLCAPGQRGSGRGAAPRHQRHHPRVAIVTNRLGMPTGEFIPATHRSRNGRSPAWSPTRTCASRSRWTGCSRWSDPLRRPQAPPLSQPPGARLWLEGVRVASSRWAQVSSAPAQPNSYQNIAAALIWRALRPFLRLKTDDPWPARWSDTRAESNHAGQPYTNQYK